MIDEQEYAWLTDMRKAYLSSADQKIGDLEHAISGLEMNPDSRGQTRRLRRLLHNLIGSGASYGFQDVTDIARKMSDRLKSQIGDGSPVDQGTLRDLKSGVEDLKKVFTEANIC